MSDYAVPYRFSPFEKNPMAYVNVDFEDTLDYIENLQRITPANRIINGDMRIDQRNGGAAVTINTTGGAYTVDRFVCYGEAADGVFTAARNTSVPTGFGFTNSLLTTVTTADASIGATQDYMICHHIEGYNIADFMFGTTDAKLFTLQFWVKSSLTGNFGGAFQNSAATRSFPFFYTINTANTWERKSITLLADTTGTWLATNGRGLTIYWSLGAGSSRVGTQGSWSGNNFTGTTGQTQVIGTNGSTFSITGVDLKNVGQLTPFEFRPTGIETSLCQRYFEILGHGVSGGWFSAVAAQVGGQFITEKRVAPTMALLTTTPTMAEPGIANRVGSGSTYANNGAITIRGFDGNIDGFAAATANHPAVMLTDSLSADSEL